MSPPLVSAIVVNWNGASDLEDCLPSLSNQTYKDLEIVVVDNGSTDQSEGVVERFEARWLALGQNVGLAAAMNAGARESKGSLLLFLNNDMRFARDFVERLVEALLERSQAFASDARQLDWSGERVLRERTVLRSGKFLRSALVRHELTQVAAEKISVTIMGSAASTLVRREMFEALQGWDSRFLIGWEDVDLSWRAWLHGWESVFVPDAICWHRVGASEVSDAGRAARYKGTVAGHLLFAVKHLPALDAVALVVATIAAGLRDALLGRRRDFQERAKSIKEFLPMVPRAIRERRVMYRSAGVTPSTHLAKLSQLGE